MTKVSFEGTFLFALNVAKNGPKKEVILSFHKMLWLVFPRSNLKWKTLQYLFSCANLISGKILVHKLLTKMLSSNQIAGFFDHQYIWKKCLIFLDFLYGDIHVGKVACETATFSWACSDVLTNLQVFTSSNLYRVSKSLFG